MRLGVSTHPSAWPGHLSVLLRESRGAVGAGEGYLPASASGGGAGSREHSWRSRPDCQTREKAFQEREPREPREAVWSVRVLMAQDRSGGEGRVGQPCIYGQQAGSVLWQWGPHRRVSCLQCRGQVGSSQSSGLCSLERRPGEGPGE